MSEILTSSDFGQIQTKLDRLGNLFSKNVLAFYQKWDKISFRFWRFPVFGRLVFGHPVFGRPVFGRSLYKHMGQGIIGLQKMLQKT